MRSWQPLRPLTLPADPGRAESPSGQALLAAPVRRIGLFWSAGNPAGLPGEADSAWTRFAAGRAAEDGDYRRPLDAVRRVGERVEGMSYGEVGDWGAAAGEVAFENSRLEPNSFADVLDPYRGTPFILTDTARVDLRRLGVRLEGGIGVRLGRWTLGLAGGHRSVDNRTRESGLPRFGRQAVYGAAVGAAREVGNGLTAGAHARYRGEAETMQMSALTEPGRVHALEGWREPTPVEFSPPAGLFRRAERRGFTVGAQLAGRLAGADWVLWGERGREDETQINMQQAEEGDPFDRWDTTSWRVGLAVRRPAGSFLIEADAGYADWSGEATQPDFEEVVYLESGSRIALDGALRWSNDADTWRARLSGGVARDQRERRDRIVSLASDLQWWSFRAGAGFARRFDDLGLELGYGFGLREPRGSIPESETFETVSGELVRDGLAVEATPLTAHRLGATVTWDVSGRTVLWLGGEYARFAPGEADVGVANLLTDGDRTVWNIAAGVVLRGG